MSELAAEQDHLDRTYAAYDALLDALSVSRRDHHGDDFTEEVLEQMRLGAYTSASGPLYFGRIDLARQEPLYIGRHAVADTHSELLTINWRAPAAEPFYAATTADPRGITRRRRARPRLSAGVNLVGLAAIKGLEFDAAIVLEPAAILDERPDGGRGGLYTAMTRSTRALAVVHSAPLPEGLADAPDLRAVRGPEGWMSISP